MWWQGGVSVPCMGLPGSMCSTGTGTGSVETGVEQVDDNFVTNYNVVNSIPDHGADTRPQTFDAVIGEYPELSKLLARMRHFGRVSFRTGVNEAVDAHTIVLDPDDPRRAVQALMHLDRKQDLLRGFQRNLLPKGEVTPGQDPTFGTYEGTSGNAANLRFQVKL